MPTSEEIRTEWKAVRSAVGTLVGYIDGKVEQFPDLEKSWQKGYDAGWKDGWKTGVDEGSADVMDRVAGAYDMGLDLAWEIARRITAIETCDEFYDLFHVDYIGDIFIKYPAKKVVEMVREYDEEKIASKPIDSQEFLEFLFNVIQPNEMEQYVSMYRSGDTPSNSAEGSS